MMNPKVCFSWTTKNETVMIVALKFSLELAVFFFHYPFFACVSQLCIEQKIIPT